MRVQFLLPVLQPHCQICRTARFPEEIEVIPHPLPLIELGHRAEKPVLSFEADRSVLDRGRFTRRRSVGKFSFGCALDRLVAGAFLLAGERLGQKIEFRFSKLEIVAQRCRQRNDAIEQARLLRRATESARQRNQNQQCD